MLLKTLKEYAYVVFGSGFARSLSLITTLIVARFLGPEEFGRFSLFFVILVITRGIPHAFDETFIRYAKACSLEIEKSNFLRIAVFLKIIYAVLLLCMSFPLAYLLANYIFLKPDTTQIVAAGFISGIFAAFFRIIESIFQEREEFGKYAILPALSSGLILVIILLFEVMKYRLPYTKGVIYIYLIVSIIFGVGSIIVLLKKVGSLYPINISEFKNFLSLSKWIVGVRIVSLFVQRIDVFVLTRYSSYIDVGIYSAAIRVTMVVSLLMGSFAAVAFPKSINAIRSKLELHNYKKISFLINSF